MDNPSRMPPEKIILHLMKIAYHKSTTEIPSLDIQTKHFSNCKNTALAWFKTPWLSLEGPFLRDLEQLTEKYFMEALEIRANHYDLLSGKLVKALEARQLSYQALSQSYLKAIEFMDNKFRLFQKKFGSSRPRK